MNSDALAPVGYGDFLVEVKTQIRQRQLSALRAVNTELIGLYWWIGQSISQRQAKLGWGKAVVQTLANDLQTEFPGRNGFSARNLWNMLDFYHDYANKPKLQPLVAEISWSKNLLILAHCKDDLEREFYLRATARFGWTKNVLRHQLDNHSYRQYLLGQTNFDAAVPDSKSRRRRCWPSKTTIPLTFWVWLNSIPNGSWNSHWWLTCAVFWRKWAVRSPLWATSSSWKAMAANTLSTCCCFTGGCAVW